MKRAKLNERPAVRRLGLGGGLLLAAFFAFGCGSVPSLESADCAAAKISAKEFYSYHFANEMAFSPENLKARERFLTPALAAATAGATPAGSDPFTTGDADFPKAFRIGACETTGPAQAKVEVVLFWKTDTRTEERKIHAEVVRPQDKWLVNRILR